MSRLFFVLLSKRQMLSGFKVRRPAYHASSRTISTFGGQWVKFSFLSQKLASVSMSWRDVSLRRGLRFHALFYELVTH